MGSPPAGASRAALTARGIDAVSRVGAVPLNSMVTVFRWGTEVGG